MVNRAIRIRGNDRENAMSKTRIYELDHLRAAAFFAVVMQHVLGFYWRHSIFDDTDNYIVGLSFGMVKFAVPMFIFLSGFVLFYNYYGRLDYMRFIGKRMVAIGIPYVLWSFFYVIYMSRSLEVFNMAWGIQFVKHLFFGSARYHLWYVSMIFQGFILLPIIFLLYGKIEKRRIA